MSASEPQMFDPRTVTTPGAVVINGNATNLPLPDESVDLIITSPPYFALRSYRDGGEHYEGQIGSEPSPQEFLEALWAATAEMVRVLKPSGSIWVNLGDKYAGSGGHNNSFAKPHAGNKKGAAHREDFLATRRNAPDRYNQNSGGIPAKSLMGLPWRYAIGCIDQLGLILRAEIIWSKPNGLPESVTDRVRRSHEQWFHFTKQGRYFSAVDEVRETHIGVDNERSARGPSGMNRGVMTGRREEPVGNFARDPLGKLPGSVWTIPSEPLIIPEAVKQAKNLPDHFAAFPQEWPRRIILGWSPSGICSACGEGRRPVVDIEMVPHWKGGTNTGVRAPDGQVLDTGYRKPRENQSATITGYACACPDTTAPTTPAVCLDPFGGTGTVAMVARSLDRFGISVDLSEDYCRLATWRIFHSGHGAKAEDRMWAERQGGLF